MYNEGISREGDLLDMAVELGIVEKSGSYYSFGETRLGQGRENAKAFLREDVELADKIEAHIREQALLPVPGALVPEKDEEAEEASPVGDKEAD
jgi:recombination protein RecA